MEGLILKGIGGLYDIQTDNGIYRAGLRGVLRRDDTPPVPGDRVSFQVLDEEARSAVIEEILPRRSFLLRPTLANLDLLFIAVAVKDPQPNLLNIDKIIALCEEKGIEPVVCITKADLADTTPLEEIYRLAGIDVITVSLNGDDPTPLLTERVKGKICAFAGASGVGKSSLLHRCFPDLPVEIGDLSRKNVRGRHTTRHVELFPCMGGWLADTPGFSRIEMLQYAFHDKHAVEKCFREFLPHIGECRFQGCAHLKEPGCAVKAALKAGKIHKSRYASYQAIYDEIKDYKDWENK